MEHLVKKFKHQRKFHYLCYAAGKLSCQRVALALQCGLSIMSCKDLNPPTPQSASSRQASLSLNLIEHAAQRCLDFYFTSFSTPAHFQTQFHSRLHWMDSTPSTERPRPSPPPPTLLLHPLRLAEWEGVAREKNEKKVWRVEEKAKNK